MKKTYILDTNVLLHDPTALYSFGNNTLVLPFPVIEEIDKHKTRQDEIGLNARQTTRIIFKTIKDEDFKKGATLLNGGSLRVVSVADVSEYIDNIAFSELDEQKNDNSILKIAYGLVQEKRNKSTSRSNHKANLPVLVTDDTLLYIKARSLDIPCEKYKKNAVVDSVANLYSGVSFVNLDTEKAIQDCYSAKSKTTTSHVTKTILRNSKNDLRPNEFVFIRHSTETVEIPTHYKDEDDDNILEEDSFPETLDFEEENKNVLNKLKQQAIDESLDDLEDEIHEIPYMGIYVPPTSNENKLKDNCALDKARRNNQSLALRYLKNKNTFKYVKGLRTSQLTPRNREQELALDLLLDPNIKLVTLAGIAGTGKTLISIAAGLQMVLHDKLYKNMIICRPLVSAGGKRNDIGFLPGNKMEKLAEWASPVKDNLKFLLNKDTPKQNQASQNNGKINAQNAARKPSKEHNPDSVINYLFEKGVIEFEALSFIRGRSFMDSYVLIEEGQNLTKEDLKTILTRIGENTKIVITGDIDQIDQPFIDSVSNGLTVAIEKFKDYDISGHITLIKGERSELATLSAKIL